MIYCFADYEFDTRLYELRQAGAPCLLEPQVFDTLAYLIRHRDRFVSKQELLERLWPNRFVSEATLSHCVMMARKALGDNGQAQRFIQTRYRRGYRFIAVVSEQHERRGSRANSAVV